MERKYFKALNFDLDTHQLKEHYTGANYRQAYDDLRRIFKRHRFSHRQGSGYIFDDKLTTADIYDLMDELSRQFPWIGTCVNKIDVTNVGRQYDLTELLKPAEDIIIDTSLATGKRTGKRITEIRQGMNVSCRISVFRQSWFKALGQGLLKIS